MTTTPESGLLLPREVPLAGVEGFCEEVAAVCWAWAAMNSLLMRLGATPVTTDAMADTADEVALGPETNQGNQRHLRA